MSEETDKPKKPANREAAMAAYFAVSKRCSDIETIYRQNIVLLIPAGAQIYDCNRYGYPNGTDSPNEEELSALPSTNVSAYLWGLTSTRSVLMEPNLTREAALAGLEEVVNLGEQLRKSNGHSRVIANHLCATRDNVSQCIRLIQGYKP